MPPPFQIDWQEREPAGPPCLARASHRHHPCPSNSITCACATLKIPRTSHSTRQRSHEHRDAHRGKQKCADTNYRSVDPLMNTLDWITVMYIRFPFKPRDAIDEVKVKSAGHANQDERASQIKRIGLHSVPRDLNAGNDSHARNQRRGAATRCRPPKKYLHVWLGLANLLGWYGDSRRR